MAKYNFNKFRPEVSAVLENDEWDSTTDVIVWLIEQVEEYHLSSPELLCENQPNRSRYQCNNGYETLEDQTATLKGYQPNTYEKQRFRFTAESDYIKVPEPENESGFAELIGYKITVEKENSAHELKPYANYVILGSDRDEFEIKEAKMMVA